MKTLLESKLESCPSGPGVYLMKDSSGRILYVGKAKNLKSRVRSYFQKGAQHSIKTERLVSQIEDIEFLRAGSEVEALLLENNLIKKWKPKYNISLKDDKSYPYLRIDRHHPYPRPYVARQQHRGDGSVYFGPYPNGWAVRETLRLAAKVFLLRDCRDHEFSNRSRPCLSHQIGQCTAPCVGLVDAATYGQQVNDYERFLKGEAAVLETQWEQEMEAAAEVLQFEKAAQLRDRLVAIRAVVYQEQRMVDPTDGTDKDIWAVWPPLQEEPLAPILDVLILQFRNGKWVGRAHRVVDLEERLGTESFLVTLMLQYYAKNALPPQVILPNQDIEDREELAQVLAQVAHAEEVPSLCWASDKGSWERLYELALENVRGLHADQLLVRERSGDALEAIARMVDLPGPPLRMECVDISNLQGEANVASCVVFVRGAPQKSDYRHYNIQGFEGQDDFASMREVMSRRYGKPGSPQPDLLVIDGGKGQLAAVLTVLKGLGCEFPVVGLAKARTQRDFQSDQVEMSEERLFLPGQKNARPIRHSGALRVLTHLRDEAHRFAIEHHRKKRSKSRFEG